MFKLWTPQETIEYLMFPGGIWHWREMGYCVAFGGQWIYYHVLNKSFKENLLYVVLT